MAAVPVREAGGKARAGGELRGVSGALAFLPERLKPLFQLLPEDVLTGLLEIRLRVGRPLAVTVRGRGQLFVGRGGALAVPDAAETFAPADAGEFLERISRSSVYALEEEFRHGYITLPGGHRVGLCGETALEGGRPRTLRHVGSFNLRIAREVPGAAERIVPHIARGPGRPRHTLVISPPGGGKTTVLRDIARRLGARLPVCVVDERSEIAACVRGVPQLDVGPCTDVVDGCPKAAGVMQALRTMSPRVIVTDEIGGPEDAAALFEAAHAGVAVIASAHGAGWEDVVRRPGLQALLNPCLFELLAVLGGSDQPGTVKAVTAPPSPRGGGHIPAAASVHIR